MAFVTIMVVRQFRTLHRLHRSRERRWQMAVVVCAVECCGVVVVVVLMLVWSVN